MRIQRATVFAASLAALSSCGGSSSSTPDYTIPADADLVVKAIPSIRWDANDYTAAAGDIKVFLANDDSVKHVLVVLKDDKVVGDLYALAACNETGHRRLVEGGDEPAEAHRDLAGLQQGFSSHGDAPATASRVPRGGASRR